ncbi:DUF2807 domain-containing protein [Flavobacterium sediminis]|uniref:DUF2807 domain-containing protein n=1 Tax=Flavobacterium sediminis TaxID=2201181 RepID=A0A2U8QTY3_9FLAO|nr:head GIN domain-containing protein [Flavobacterium sediminis]AWM13643.1 DUF2807 domain-containing protein [Flavobacterium sediminis]
MKKLFFTTLLVSSLAFSQVEKKLGDFDKVTSFDQIDVQLVKGNENKIIIKGDRANEVEVVNKNGELKIRMPLTKLLQGDNISVTLYYTHLEAVEANEGSRIASNDVFKAINFEIILKEGSEISLQLEVERLSARTANGSILELKGTAEYADVLVNSGAKYEAEDLITKQTVITANAGGEAEIYATDFVDAKVRAGGDILIYGKPKQINQKTIAGGSIEQAE